MAQTDNFTWLVEETIKEMMNPFITFLRFKLQTHITLSNVIPWSIQDTAIQPFGLVKNSSLLLDQEKRKTVPKSNVKCITLISIFGLKCLISMLVDIIILLAPSTINSFMFSAELQMLLESISTLSRNTTMTQRRDGRLLRSVPNFSEIDKVAVSSKETIKTSLSSVDFQADFWRILTWWTFTQTNLPELNLLQTSASFSKCQFVTILKLALFLPATFNNNQFINSTERTIGASTKVWRITETNSRKIFLCTIGF